LEVALEILLVVGLLVKISAVVSGVVAVSFTIAKIVTLARGQDISICGILMLALHKGGLIEGNKANAKGVVRG
jgi:hypothetical protein